ncbi:oxidoreductase [Fusarium beomiforme]|uniref:Oxidoreductase n=1 Tax=Fusarium beomiforme TaxID=44412 RepID=A0A9P5ABN5_9HYPO|nr:oxidoreductase [Fusarium beomiforme]
MAASLQYDISRVSRLLALLSLAAGGLMLYTIIKYALQSRRPSKFPPGPRALPIVGNLHLLSQTKAFLQFSEWGRKYGTIIGLKLGPQNVVILNDYKHVQDHIANDIMFTNDTHILFVPYGDSWRKLRKTLQGLLNIKAVDRLLPIQNAEAMQMMHQLLHSPDDWYDHVRRYSTSVILASVFGLRGPTFEHPRVEALYHVQDQLTRIAELGATPPVDVFPILQYLPDFLSPWRTWARNIRKEHRALYFGLLRETQELVAEKKAPEDAFMVRLLKEQDTSGFDDEHMAYIGGTLMEAGSDTTASTLLSFILAMALFPESLAKCQAEVDSICGAGRSPTFNDFESLTYLKAAMTETLRWRPVAAGGIPHALTQDDYYEGYYLPKGTILFANAWAIHRSSDYDAPDQFYPERFLNNKFGTVKDAALNSEDKRRPIYGFGAGRRVCPGQRLAENSLVPSSPQGQNRVWAFDMRPAAEDIDDSMETGYTGGFLVAPKKFPVRITPRSADREAVIQNCAMLPLEHGAVPNQLIGPGAMSTALFQVLAVEYDTRAVEFLLGLPSILFNVSPRKRFTALHAPELGMLMYNFYDEFEIDGPGDVYDLLLRKWNSKVEFAACEIRGYTALHWVCLARDLSLIERLLSAIIQVGADVNIMTGFLGSPVWKQP